MDNMTFVHDETVLRIFTSVVNFVEVYNEEDINNCCLVKPSLNVVCGLFYPQISLRLYIVQISDAVVQNMSSKMHTQHLKSVQIHESQI